MNAVIDLIGRTHTCAHVAISVDTGPLRAGRLRDRPRGVPGPAVRPGISRVPGLDDRSRRRPPLHSTPTGRSADVHAPLRHPRTRRAGHRRTGARPDDAGRSRPSCSSSWSASSRSSGWWSTGAPRSPPTRRPRSRPSRRPGPVPGPSQCRRPPRRVRPDRPGRSSRRRRAVHRGSAGTRAPRRSPAASSPCGSPIRSRLTSSASSAITELHVSAAASAVDVNGVARGAP